MTNTDRALPTVTILGAGFSGLVTAYFLQRAGWRVVVHEASARVGGLIDTRAHAWGYVESAANGVLNSAAFEDLCAEIGVALISASATPAGKRRFIFRCGKASRWPLTIPETLAFFTRLPRVRRKGPLPNETVEHWAIRAFGKPPFHALIAPALQGIYAGDPGRLSADLVFGRFFAPRRQATRRPHLRGTVAPVEGMGEFTRRLAEYLRSRGVEIHLSSRPTLSSSGLPVVIATPVHSAAEILAGSGEFREAAEQLAKIETLPLLSVSLAFAGPAGAPAGFGCLFARGEGVRSLGVLYENSVFPGRSPHHLERWILGGATDPTVGTLSDEEIKKNVLADRLRFTRKDAVPLAVDVIRWPAALPHYTDALATALRHEALTSLPRRGIHLIGNYTGRLGLSGILEKAEQLAETLGKLR